MKDMPIGWLCDSGRMARMLCWGIGRLRTKEEVIKFAKVWIRVSTPAA